MKRSSVVRFVAAFGAAMLLSAAASATVLTSRINVDNSFSVYISTDDTVAGTLFGSGNDWTLTSIDTVALASGTDYFLHVFAHNDGGPDGFLGDFSLTGDHHFDNGTASLTTGASSWSGNATGFGAGGSVTELASNGDAPWGFQGMVGGNAKWIWATEAGDNVDAFFSTRILADATDPANVPEPATMALLACGLLGVAASRRKNAQR